MTGVVFQVFLGTSCIDTSDFPSNHRSLSDLIHKCHEYLKVKSSPRQEHHTPVEAVERLETVLTQCQKVVQKNCRLHMKSNYSQVRLTDIGGDERHFLTLQQTDRLTFKVHEHSLPDIGVTFPTSGTIDQYLFAFEQSLELMDDFYSNLDAIDLQCLVVDPAPITSKHTYRIFQLSKKIFLRVDLNPLNASAVIVKIIGPSDDIEPLRRQYITRSEDWDIDQNVHNNLLRIFDIVYFPVPHQVEEETCCNICYTYRLDNQIPIISCDNPRCDLIFHYVCLREWFATLESSKTFLKITMGSCPFCKAVSSKNFRVKPAIRRFFSSRNCRRVSSI
jgi:E3 ubiquitin-protein ligase FANCL